MTIQCSEKLPLRIPEAGRVIGRSQDVLAIRAEYRIPNRGGVAAQCDKKLPLRIPEFCSVVVGGCQNTLAIRAKHCPRDYVCVAAQDRQGVSFQVP